MKSAKKGSSATKTYRRSSQTNTQKSVARKQTKKQSQGTEKGPTPLTTGMSTSEGLEPKMGIETLQSEVSEQTLLSAFEPTSKQTKPYIVYPYFAMEVNFYPTETLQKLYFEPVNEQSIKMRTPEDYLKPTEYMGKQGFLLSRHQRGDLFINTARVQKEYDPILKQNFYLIDTPPNHLELPETRQTPRNERKHLLREFLCFLT